MLTILIHLASLLNLYTIPNVNVEEVPTTPSSAMNTYVFIEEEIFIPRRLKDDINQYAKAISSNVYKLDIFHKWQEYIL